MELLFILKNKETGAEIITNWQKCISMLNVKMCEVTNVFCKLTSGEELDIDAEDGCIYSVSCKNTLS